MGRRVQVVRLSGARREVDFRREETSLLGTRTRTCSALPLLLRAVLPSRRAAPGGYAGTWCTFVSRRTGLTPQLAAPPDFTARRCLHFRAVRVIRVRVRARERLDSWIRRRAGLPCAQRCDSPPSALQPLAVKGFRRARRARCRGESGARSGELEQEGCVRQCPRTTRWSCCRA